MSSPIIELKGITKQYPAVKALDTVDFHLYNGEIHSFLGENGAGKSTLMKVVYGLVRPDEGEIFFNGEKVSVASPYDAIALGIGMVHQHFMLVPVLTVFENIVLGAEPKRRWGIFDRRKARAEITSLIEKFNFKIDPDKRVGDLSVGEQQRVEILKAMYKQCTLLILDEPTAVLTPNECDELFAILKKLRDRGMSVVLITHKLRETLACADSLSVIRHGKMVLEHCPAQNFTREELADCMVGKKVTLGAVRRSTEVGENCLSIRNISLVDKGIQILDGVSIDLHKNRIVGIAGVEGNGQSELIEILTGLRKADSGEIVLNGKKLLGGAQEFIRAGIGHVPEDRGSRGLVNGLTIRDNLILGHHRQFAKFWQTVMDNVKITSYAEHLRVEYDIRSPDTSLPISSLSGGNAQKAVIARVYSQENDAYIVAQPTRGVDIGAMEYIHKKTQDLRDEGNAILLVSSDLDELKTLSDEICVIYEGKIVARDITENFDDTRLSVLMNTGSEP